MVQSQWVVLVFEVAQLRDLVVLAEAGQLQVEIRDVQVVRLVVVAFDQLQVDRLRDLVLAALRVDQEVFQAEMFDPRAHWVDLVRRHLILDLLWTQSLKTTLKTSDF